MGFLGSGHNFYIFLAKPPHFRLRYGFIESAAVQKPNCICSGGQAQNPAESEFGSTSGPNTPASYRPHWRILIQSISEAEDWREFEEFDRFCEETQGRNGPAPAGEAAAQVQAKSTPAVS